MNVITGFRNPNGGLMLFFFYPKYPLTLKYKAQSIDVDLTGLHCIESGKNCLLEKEKG